MNAMILLAQGAMNMADSLATANPVLTEVNAPEMNMLDMAIKGGWIMIVLGVLSVVCFYILFERNYMIRKAGKEDPMFMERIKDYIHSGEIKAAINYCRTMNTPSARMIEKGISRLGRPINDVQVAIENVGNIEVAKLEKGLTVMATISGGAPMLGFLGTVTGMVRAFYEMANAGSGNIDITLLSGGIYEAMITTVGGLIVGVVVATPGGVCGRLPVRARSCWVRGCGRAGGALPAWSVDDLPGGMWMQRATWAAVWLCAAGHGCRRGGAAACAAMLDAVQCELR